MQTVSEVIDTFRPLGEITAGVVEKLAGGAGSGAIECYRVDPENDREGWLALRQHDVTASTVAALLGAHPWITPAKLWNLKKGLTKEDPEETPAMLRGRLLEEPAVKLMRKLKPHWKITYPVGLYYRDPKTRMGATPDVLVENEHGKGIVQIKSVEPSVFRNEWRQEDGSVEPPAWIACQALVEAHLTGLRWAAVAPIVVGHGVDLPITPIELHAGIIERLTAEVAEFWRRVENNIPYPMDYGRDGELIAKLYPKDNGAEIDLSSDNELPGYVDQLIEARATKSAAEEREKEAKAAITHKMGLASFARIADGRRISNKLQGRNVKCKHATDDDGEPLFCSQSQYRVARVVR
jgi:predicted phage-related endonuclease